MCCAVSDPERMLLIECLLAAARTFQRGDVPQIPHSKTHSLQRRCLPCMSAILKRRITVSMEYMCQDKTINLKASMYLISYGVLLSIFNEHFRGNPALSARDP